MKKNIKHCIAILLMLIIKLNSISQLTYIGLKEEANVYSARNKLPVNYATYFPKMHIENDFIYIASYDGIYRKHLDTLHDNVWELYAFHGWPIRDFIVNKDTLLAITAVNTGKESSDSLLLLTTNDGKTFDDITPVEFFNHDWDKSGTLLIAQNPRNRNTVAVHSIYQINTSNDFGQTWSILNSTTSGGNEKFLGFNPNDTANIFYTGSQIFYDSFIMGTYDYGQNWSTIEQRHSTCTNGIAFHPTDKKYYDFLWLGLVGKID